MRIKRPFFEVQNNACHYYILNAKKSEQFKMMIMMKIPQIESLIVNIKVCNALWEVVLALCKIFYCCVVSCEIAIMVIL